MQPVIMVYHLVFEFTTFANPRNTSRLESARTSLDKIIRQYLELQLIISTERMPIQWVVARRSLSNSGTSGPVAQSVTVHGPQAVQLR